ncbi:hypothetical protein ACT17G_18495 [Bacillus velezensis]|uniref:hypothetical protein n=1 Tax=Bacillus TaxID=1386 RepID=UPI000B23A987|nr:MULTISPECIES: hypothetical protein [Bacillus]UFH22557.1 hypothetical protein LOK79_18420 [Bacillus velezensis]UUT17181.1 hypothetical protein NRF13_19030 [Bacillus velezensis]BET19651.1 hypothetical protein RBIBE_36410 [Bacillus velezensis]
MNERKERQSLYLNQELADNLLFLSKKTNVSMNGLTNLAISKLLLEMGLTNIDLETEKTIEPIKETKYCKLLNQVTIKSGPYICAIEKIIIKETEKEEIRFAYYRKSKNNVLRLINRPLDIDEETLLSLFIKAIIENIFGDEFKRKLKSIL